MAWASSGPDNKYCQAGNHPTFGDHDGPAALPQACIYTALSATPSPGKTISVKAGGNLQSALNSAQCGDTISIDPSATLVGIFNLNPNKCDANHWITIRTSAARFQFARGRNAADPVLCGRCFVAGEAGLRMFESAACDSADFQPRSVAGIPTQEWREPLSLHRARNHAQRRHGLHRPADWH